MAQRIVATRLGAMSLMALIAVKGSRADDTVLSISNSEGAIVASEIANNQFTIKTDKPNIKVSWQVTGIRQDAWANAHRIQVEVDKRGDERGKYLTSVEEGRAETFAMEQNCLNPFNPATMIEYSVPKRSQVTIEIFDVLGQKVRTLVNESKSAGSYRVEWNGTDNTGNSLSSGKYLYRFQAGAVVQTKKMLPIK